MVTRALTGNIWREATITSGNIFPESMRHAAIVNPCRCKSRIMTHSPTVTMPTSAALIPVRRTMHGVDGAADLQLHDGPFRHRAGENYVADNGEY